MALYTSPLCKSALTPHLLCSCCEALLVPNLSLQPTVGYKQRGKVFNQLLASFFLRLIQLGDPLLWLHG